MGEKKKAEVMVLGAYHMSNPGLDLVKSKIKDVLLAERQKEIAELVDSLKRFKPTKVALEAVDDGPFNERYAAYLRGEHSLERDEREQVGFRLAKELSLPRIYAIDSKLDLDFDKPMAFLAQHNKPRFDRLNGLITKIGPLMEEIDQKYTVGQILAIYNCDESVRFNHDFYMEMLCANDGKEFPGADMLSDWYKRNLRIYCRIENIVEPGDRVLVLIGSGHVKYLRDIIRDSEQIEFVSPMKYLPKPPAVAKIDL